MKMKMQGIKINIKYSFIVANLAETINCIIFNYFKLNL